MTAIRLRESALVTPDRVVSRAANEHDLSVGACEAEELPATGTWAPDGQDVGRVACWIEGGDAVVEWSHERDGLLFRVTRGNRDEGGVIGLWQSVGMAVWSAIREAGGSVDPDAFPDAAERQALEMLPADIRDSCTRGDRSAIDTESGDTQLVPIAGLSCDLVPGSGADLLEVRLLPRSTQFGPDVIIGFEARARAIEPGDCASTSRAHGRWSIGGQEVGAVVCYPIPDGSANVSWTLTDRNLYLWAIRDDGDQAALWDWFTANARFIGQ